MTTIDDVISSPGEILLEEFLEPLGISQYRLAKAIGKPQSAISEIVHGQRAITPEMAVLLGKALSTSPQFWLNLEMAYQLKMVDSSSLAHVTPLVDELAEARLLGRKTHIGIAAAFKRRAVLRFFADGLLENVVRLLIQRVLQIVHAREIAEDRLSRTVERFCNRTCVHRSHSFLAEHGKRSFQDHFPCNSLFGRHKIHFLSLN